MKTIIITFALLLGSLLGASAQCTELSGNLNANLTLNAATCYHMTGCFVVPNGITLTIPAGTNILCASGANLVVERGGKLMATGTSLNPIVFTSDQTTGSRQRGDWGGIAIFGKAPNNESLNATREVCIDRTFGGSVSNDNSGTLEYIRIEYAGDITDRDDAAALALYSVGNLTTIDHIQVSESAGDAFLSMGGTYNAKYLLSLNAAQTTDRFRLGYTGMQQFILGITTDITAHISSSYNTNGIYIDNDFNGSSNTPLTNPLLSNVTILYPEYCGSVTLSSDFKNGITFNHNGAGNIRNSAFGGAKGYGLEIIDISSVSNTASNLLNFSSNAIISTGGTGDFFTSASWATGCGGSLGSMSNWINGPVVFGCEQSGNDFSLSSFGYHSSLCGSYCTTRPTVTYSGSNLSGTDFSAPFNTFFTNVAYKGAIGTTDWTSIWASFCPQSNNYCSCAAPAQKISDDAAVRFVPNPANHSTYAVFNTAATGSATISVLDKVSGRTLISVPANITQAGAQKISFSVKGLKEGVYPVRIATQNGILYGQLVVK